jgi:hypothetical protein
VSRQVCWVIALERAARTNVGIAPSGRSGRRANRNSPEPVEQNTDRLQYAPRHDHPEDTLVGCLGPRPGQQAWNLRCMFCAPAL